MKSKGKLAPVFVLVLAAAVLGLNACYKPAAVPAPAPATAPSPTAVRVDISGFAFSPPEITVAPGTKVTWIHQAPTPHTVTSDTGIFKSGNLSRNASFSYTFTTRGTFSYHCSIHPSMKGKVIVE